MNLKVRVRLKISDMCRDINDFKKGYQNTVKEEKGDLVTDFQSILARWRNHFSATEWTWG